MGLDQGGRGGTRTPDICLVSSVRARFGGQRRTTVLVGRGAALPRHRSDAAGRGMNAGWLGAGPWSWAGLLCATAELAIRQAGHGRRREEPHSPTGLGDHLAPPCERSGRLAGSCVQNVPRVATLRVASWGQIMDLRVGDQRLPPVVDCRAGVVSAKPRPIGHVAGTPVVYFWHHGDELKGSGP
jgi:hypothetical protein